MSEKETADLVCRFVLLKRRAKELFALDYAHPDYWKALNECEKFIEKNIDDLNQATASARPNTIRSVCSSAALNSNSLISCLGILANAGLGENLYECHGPLRSLFKKVLGQLNDIDLILTKDWLFNALIYPKGPKPLDQFTIVGLPASEGTNPLLIALAGHEIGHSIFHFKRDVSDKLGKVIDDKVSEILNDDALCGSIGVSPKAKSPRENLANAADFKKLCLRPIEELFCDAVGVYLFGRSFLFSYHYVLKSSPWSRSINYPEGRFRSESLTVFAKEFGIDAPELDLNFHRFQSSADRRTKIVDAVIERCRAALPAIVQSYFNEKRILPPNADLIETAKREMDSLVPVDGRFSMVEIINAGWECFEEAKANPSELADFKMTQIFEIVFKSLEFLEIREKLEQ